MGSLQPKAAVVGQQGGLNETSPLGLNGASSLSSYGDSHDNAPQPLKRTQEEVTEILADSDSDLDSNNDSQKHSVKRLKTWREDQAQAREREQNAMYESESGRAFLLVESILRLHETMISKSKKNQDMAAKYSITPVGKDDMFFLAKNLIKCQEDFMLQNIPHQVTLAYHYTSVQSLPRIRQDGLLSYPERNNLNIQTRHGAYFGEGIYTGKNPLVFRSYGNTGILLAIVKGREVRVDRGGTKDPNINTAVGNKLGTDVPLRDYGDEVILRESRQVLPLIRFYVDATTEKESYDLIAREYCTELQKVLDHFLNFNVSTLLPPISPFLENNSILANAPQQVKAIAAAATVPTVAPATLAIVNEVMKSAILPVVLTYTAPATLSPGESAFQRVKTLQKSEDCSICCSGLRCRGRVVQPQNCGCLYHKDCLEQALNQDFRCPKCRTPVGEPQGKCPSGILTISHIHKPCGGYEAEKFGTIVLDYNLLSGIQSVYHESPGLAFSGTCRKAFLPNNEDGRDLLLRLRYAWSRGLLFTIGTSLTTGKQGQIVWSSVHQKTSIRGGVHGFPDPNFFANGNTELDTLHVPSAKELRQSNDHSPDFRSLLLALESL